jgi:hypothetical protein
MSKKEYNTKPTMKQKKALDNMVENGGNVSKGMRDAGYSEKTAINPSKLTESKGFQQLADEYLPDDFLLNALEEDIAEKKGNRKPEMELAFKVKGKLVEKRETTSKIEVSKELEETANKAIEKFLNNQ